MRRKIHPTLRKRENLIDRAALVARLNALGETRRSQIHLQNLINEHSRLPKFVDPEVQRDSAAIGHLLRRNEAQLARDFTTALMRPTRRARTSPAPEMPSQNDAQHGARNHACHGCSWYAGPHAEAL